MAFDSLPTEIFRKKMRPYAERIYESLWPGCKIVDLRDKGVKVHILDREFGIDTLSTFPSGQWISIQEKYRQHKFLVEPKLQVKPPDPDFTQEYKNAAGTKYESDGEWFKLGAQLYFYGWANESESGFEKWMLLDIAKYKLAVEQLGGLDRIGQLNRNRKHGAASFYCIPIPKLASTLIAQSKPKNKCLSCDSEMTSSRLFCEKCLETLRLEPKPKIATRKW